LKNNQTKNLPTWFKWYRITYYKTKCVCMCNGKMLRHTSTAR